MFAMGIIDNDPVVKILCIGCLALTTYVLGINTWLFLFKRKENA